jgi:hypothetical protein
LSLLVARALIELDGLARRTPLLIEMLLEIDV